MDAWHKYELIHPSVRHVLPTRLPLHRRRHFHAPGPDENKGSTIHPRQRVPVGIHLQEDPACDLKPHIPNTKSSWKSWQRTMVKNKLPRTRDHYSHSLPEIKKFMYVRNWTLLDCIPLIHNQSSEMYICVFLPWPVAKCAFHVPPSSQAQYCRERMRTERQWSWERWK